MIQLFIAWACCMHATMTDVIPQAKATTPINLVPHDILSSQWATTDPWERPRARTGHECLRSPPQNASPSTGGSHGRAGLWGLTLLSEKLEQKKCFAKGKASCVAVPAPPEINIV